LKVSEVVERWVDRLKGNLPPIGDMTHWERMEAAFNLEEPDMVPVAPELDYWQITYAGYGHPEIYNDVDKTTDACIKTWADLRTDAIWMYVDISHQIENFIPAEKRAEHFFLRGPKDYVLFKPIASTLDEAIALYEEKAYAKYAEDSRAVTHYTPHMLQLLEFQEKMDRVVPVIVGAATPTNYAETIVGVDKFVKWLITEPEEKVRHYLELCLEERLEALEFYRDYAAANGCEFFCAWGGARTWGPKQLEKFIYVDEIFIEKAKTIFKNIFWHICGHNLPQAMEWVAGLDGVKAVQYDMPYYSMDLSWPEWFEWVAKLFQGRKCAMNSPTTQLACHGTPEEIEKMVRDFIEHTTPYTTAVVMPGCEIDSYAPVENVKAIIDAARKYGRR
jgi:uroporphyrinogen-III decarboxylase